MTNPCRLPLKPRFLGAMLEKLLALDVLAKVYDDRPANATPQEFLKYTIAQLGVTLDISNPAHLQEIPKEGPVLIVANHPLGGLEGVAIASVISDVRPDLQVLTNQLLRRIPELAPVFIGVDVLSGNAAADNVAGIKKVHKHLKNAGAVLIFPAGMVSTREPGSSVIQDRAWTRLVGQLVKRYACTTVPVYVGGRNSDYFYAAGRIHPRLRTILLPRQMANKKNSTLPLTIGRPIPAQEIRLLENPSAITEYLRISTDVLSVSHQENLRLAENGARRASLKPAENQPGPVDEGGDSKGEKAEKFMGNDPADSDVSPLQDCRLIEHEQFDVYCAPYDRLGPIMEQIAIAREITFREVGEGTGNEKDSDEFDPHYLHLFLWDKVEDRIAGAYRVGLVDEIVAKYGVQGLYSRSLYDYDEAFINKLGSAVEMGRSFIHPDYQRSSIALNLLWRGISKILVLNPKYHTLFGSVSISREYSDLARSLIADTLLTNFRATEFADLVTPLTPHKVENRVWSEDMLCALSNVKMLGKLIGRCDPGKAVPVLLRHYLSLNGRMVCFNIHSEFNDSLEGLIIVDVRMTDRKTMNRFMGVEGAESFFKQHSLQETG